MIRGDRVAINISPLCGDDSVHILQRTNRRTFEAKPKSEVCESVFLNYIDETWSRSNNRSLLLTSDF
jgi:hypothetical protein